ncbi:hypothetical protein EXIGLDRAFT_405656 [Exidia glandulosa HHB12029]|uniref:phytol kinase n=1 Tax=Exidia glandulosa HHB12029 TaxID=1314781 RepID=A0A165BJP3_EXIGL|nr:hypothetical protein EXIGLDRAFT_405656 [Exidia glandulosa HHB12029]
MDGEILIITIRALYDSCTTELYRQPYVLMLVNAMHLQLGFALAELQGRPIPFRSKSNPQNRLDYICPFLQAILLSGATTTDSITTSCRPIAGKLLDTLNALLDVVPASAGETRNAMCDIGWVMHGLSARPDESVHPSILENERAVPHNGYEMLYRSLQRVLQRSACGSTSCRLTERQTGLSMRLCGRCRVYLYCNQECQRHHWRASHKEVCRGLQALFQQIHVQLPLNLSEPAFVAACRANDADVGRIARLYGAIAIEDPKTSPGQSSAMLERILTVTHNAAESGSPVPDAMMAVITTYLKGHGKDNV